jgi:hypothetical protein
MPLAAALAAAAALSGCGGGSHQSSSITHGKTTPPNTNPAPTAQHGNDQLISIFGGAAQVQTSPTATLQTLRMLGVDRIRVDVRWNQIAPEATSRHEPAGFNATDPGSYPAASWTQFDQVFQIAAKDGIGVEATVGGPAPLWAENPGDPMKKKEPQGVWKPKPALFAQFVRAVAERYSGHYKPPGTTHPLPRISFWSIWNEPDYGQDLAPQTKDHSTVEIAPGLYRGLLQAGYAALKASGDGQDTILYGEIAPAGQSTGNEPGQFHLMTPLRFLRALYCVNMSFQILRGSAATERGCPATGTEAGFRAANPALFDATGLAAHPYPQTAGPPTQRAPDEPDFADFASRTELEQTLDRAYEAYGDSRKVPIYNTEFGYITDPPVTYRATPAQAAAYLNETEYLSWLNPRIRSYDQYLLEDPPPAQSHFATGLETSTATPKATFDAYRLPLYLPQTTQTGGGALGVWGCIRPEHFYPSSTSVAIQFAKGTGTTFTTLRTVTPSDVAGYFDVTMTFPASGSVRLAWSYPGGPTVYSRTVTVTVH